MCIVTCNSASQEGVWPGSTIAKLAAEVGPAVIGLREGSRGGSGVIVAEGVAVTLARNVHRDELTVRVGERDIGARVAGTDPTVDLAVLRFESPAEHRAGRWAADVRVGIGFEVYAARRSLRSRPARQSRHRLERADRSARTCGTDHRGRHRAHRAAAARIGRQSTVERGGPDPRTERDPARRRIRRRLARGCAARPRRRAGGWCVGPRRRDSA